MLADNPAPRNSVKELCRVLFFPVIFFWLIIVEFIDKHLFDGKFEKRQSANLQEQFAAEIQERVPSLFTRFGGRVIPNTEVYPPAFEYAEVTISLDAMLLRFVRGRMDFRVDVTPPDKPTSWWEVSSVVKNSEHSHNPSRKVDYYGLNDFDRFFQANFDIICQEVSKPSWRSQAGWLVPIG